jgi:hypothetical protein
MENLTGELVTQSGNYWMVCMSCIENDTKSIALLKGDAFPECPACQDTMLFTNEGENEVARQAIQAELEERKHKDE